MNLQFVHPVNRSKRSGASRYKVNSIKLPRNIKQANDSIEHTKWYDATMNELNSIESNNVWERISNS